MRENGRVGFIFDASKLSVAHRSDQRKEQGFFRSGRGSIEPQDRKNRNDAKGSAGEFDREDFATCIAKLAVASSMTIDEAMDSTLSHLTLLSKARQARDATLVLAIGQAVHYAAAACLSDRGSDAFGEYQRKLSKIIQEE